ncbi:MAG TPA: helix-turn-helix transcriptional regulator [Verrucomicrobiales bacterium]|jgi:transcriptional regulator with XRE-family HTH domain|nr:helix-turn-helix transcriptional regulator [Verrucomicrobiales bacterium]
MSRAIQEIDLETLSNSLRTARERKGWTLEHLARELWVRGFATSQNKLWRLENNPPSRIDTELLLWLEKVLEVDLLGGDNQHQVLIDDVVSLIESFHSPAIPPAPKSQGLRRIHDQLKQLLRKRAG